MNLVPFEIVKKQMLKYKRVVYYMKDPQGGLISCNDDSGADLQSIIDELEELITEMSGQFAIIELPEQAKGKGKVGGTSTKFVYRVRCGNNNNNQSTTGFSGGGGNMQMMLMDRMFAMQNEMSKTQIDLLKGEIERMKSTGKEALIEKFAETVMNRYEEGSRVSKVASKAKQAGAIADETKHHKKQSKRVLEAIKDLREVDNDYLDNLAFLAAYAKKNPTIYNSFINELKKGSE